MAGAYLWFVLLSPALLRMLRAWPRATLGAAIVLPVALHLQLATVGGWIEAQANDLAQYGACWLLGMAHRDGQLARVRSAVLWPAVGLLAVVTIVSVVAAGHTLATVDLHSLPVLNALWSAAYATVVLRLTPPASATAWLARSPALARGIRAVNARVLTIYLWHFPSLLLARWLTGFEPGIGPWLWPSAALMVAFTAVAALAFGWVEDLAARRRVNHLPWRMDLWGSSNRT